MPGVESVGIANSLPMEGRKSARSELKCLPRKQHQRSRKYTLFQ